MQRHSGPVPTHIQDATSTRPPQSFIDVCAKSIKMIWGVYTPFGSSILWCLLKEYRRHTVQWARRAHVICQANLLESHIDFFPLFFSDSLASGHYGTKTYLIIQCVNVRVTITSIFLPSGNFIAFLPSLKNLFLGQCPSAVSGTRHRLQEDYLSMFVRCSFSLKLQSVLFK